MAAFHDGLAMDAQHRHFNRRCGNRTIRQLVIERAGEDARRRRFTDAADAGENPRLRNPPASNAFETVRTMAS